MATPAAIPRAASARRRSAHLFRGLSAFFEPRSRRARARLTPSAKRSRGSGARAFATTFSSHAGTSGLPSGSTVPELTLVRTSITLSPGNAGLPERHS